MPARPVVPTADPAGGLLRRPAAGLGGLLLPVEEPAPAGRRPARPNHPARPFGPAERVGQLPGDGTTGGPAAQRGGPRSLAAGAGRALCSRPAQGLCSFPLPE